MFPLSFLYTLLTIIYVLFLTMTMISISYVSSLVVNDGKFSFLLSRSLDVPKTIYTSSFPIFPIYRGQNLQAVMEDEVTTEDYNYDEDLEEKKVVTKLRKEIKINPKYLLKKEISTLETTICHKRRRLSNLQSLTDDYSQSGFARKVAELDSLRKNLNLVHQSHVNKSMALVMKIFLPVLDYLLELNERYEREQNDFAIKGYGALASEMKDCLYGLGLERSNIQVGSPFNRNQMKVLRVVENQSPEELKLHDSECVVEVIKDGYKYKGNFVRLADVIVTKSLQSKPISTKRTISKDKAPVDESPNAR